MTLQKRYLVAIALFAICCMTIPHGLAASSTTAPDITYTATGTFASPPMSGADTLELAGEPFEVSIVVSAATEPYKTGENWDAYHELHLTGSVHSGLVGQTPITIGSTEASIIQAIDPTSFDQFTMEAPIKVVGINLTIDAVIEMPYGTLSKPTLHYFTNPITLSPANAKLTYSDGSTTTVLAIASGTLTATIPTGNTSSRVKASPSFGLREHAAIVGRRFEWVG